MNREMPVERFLGADGIIWLAQTPAAAPTPYAPASWDSYGGGEAALLAIALFVVASGFAYAGQRLRIPARIKQPGGTTAGLMIVIWLLAIANVIVAVRVYGLQVMQAYPGFVGLHPRVGTFVDAPVTFLVILFLTWRWGWKVALASAVIGTAVAPMIFELPFDLIVMTRTNPPIPTHPMLYRQLFFLPLFLAEFSTISLLTLLPSMRITAHACYAVAGMFAVFAVWAAFGFAFPSEPLPLALNVISKILCFVAAIMLFVWRAERSVASP
jgi:hypothetical protein